MTHEEFSQLQQMLCDPDATDVPGYYPAMPWNARIAGLWFKHLQRYPLALCLRALEMHAMADTVHPPSLDTFLQRVKDLQPPPGAPWQQFATAQVEAYRDGGYSGVLKSLEPREGRQPISERCRYLLDNGLLLKRHAAAAAQACRTFADQYPEERAIWEEWATDLEAQAQEVPQEDTGHRSGVI